MDEVEENAMTKEEAILVAIRNTSVGDNIILHNNDWSVWCILKVICKEHPESMKEDGGVSLQPPPSV